MTRVDSFWAVKIILTINRCFVACDIQAVSNSVTNTIKEEHQILTVRTKFEFSITIVVTEEKHFGNFIVPQSVKTSIGRRFRSIVDHRFRFVIEVWSFDFDYHSIIICGGWNRMRLFLVISCKAEFPYQMP